MGVANIEMLASQHDVTLFISITALLANALAAVRAHLYTCTGSEVCVRVTMHFVEQDTNLCMQKRHSPI